MMKGLLKFLMNKYVEIEKNRLQLLQEVALFGKLFQC